MSVIDLIIKEEYIPKINELLHQCNDLALVDLVYKLLKKACQE